MNGALSLHPIHLGLGATAFSEPEFTGLEWSADYVSRHASDGLEGRLVSMHSFDTLWDSWKVHPNGHEVVLCTEGEITLIHEVGGDEVRTTLRAGEYAIQPPGVWHTADAAGPATALFTTAGMGTEHRPRT